jgi:uroporphyrinogen decarboxylase
MKWTIMSSERSARLTHRERVLLCLNHQEADRVPRDLMGNATMILDASYFSLIERLGLPRIPPFRVGTTANYYDERVLDRFDIDFRRVFLPPDERANAVIPHPDGTFSDAWGIRFERDGLYVTTLNHPLAEASTLEDVEAYPWPVGTQLFRAEGLREKARLMYEKTDFAIVARNPFSPGFIDRASQLMGTENFLVGLYTAPEVVESILGHILKIYMSVYEGFLGEVGSYVQMVETADDIGTQSSLLISPEAYRHFIKPLEKAFYGRIHEMAPEAFLFRHCDGSIYPLMEDLIEVGVDVLNPVQTSSAGMDADRLKKDFGGRICFHGAIEKLNGSLEELGLEVERMMKSLKPGGGYVFAPCNHIVDARPESILALFEAAESVGGYSSR